MSNFTENENHLLGLFKDKSFFASIIQIRESACNIWRSDNPKIIQNYTDHGISHSQRLIDWIVKILKANHSKELSDNELYILLAGTYLHDIGMQSDVVKHPEIKKISEKIGATYEKPFISTESNNYSIDEQNEIRKNHHYLSAAWIDYAYQEKTTSLSDGVRTVPDFLIDDLIDVCLYHSKLPISNCPKSFRYIFDERKQLVAAILRLTDELDIDAKRISLSTINNFNINPLNAIYWYLHKSIIVDFENTNIIKIIIRLHPQDYSRSSDLLTQKLIDDFRSKNRSLLTVLANNSIPILLSDNSTVVEDKRVAEFPVEINKILHNSTSSDDSINEITKEVRTWIRAIHYEVCDVIIQSDRVQIMEATFKHGPITQHVIIKCVDGSIVQSDLDHLERQLSRKNPEGWIISDRQISHTLLSEIVKYDGISLFTFSEFMKKIIWGPYFDYIKSNVEKEKIPQYYIHHSCHKVYISTSQKPQYTENISILENYVDDWLSARGKIQLSILGSFGSGKTWFCKYYAHKQLLKYFDDPTRERLPLLIKLRGYIKSTTIQQLIYDALVEQYNLPFFGKTYDIIQELNLQGKLLFILDGFDEMAQQVDDQTVVSNYKEITKLVTSNSKIILTSRTEYFKLAKQVEDTFGDKFELLYLNSFSDEQVVHSIYRRLGPEKGKDAAQTIMAADNLSEMIHKPILMELLLAVLDENIDIIDNPAKVYLYATNKLLLRNIEHGNTFTSTYDKLYFLSELAWEMIKTGDLRIHYKDIPNRIREFFKSKIKNPHDIDYWDSDLRSQTLLHRDVFGYYEFAHKSIAEYLVAYKFAAELGIQEKIFDSTYCEIEGGTCQKIPKITSYNILGNSFGLKHLFANDMLAVAQFFSDIVDVSKLSAINDIIKESARHKPDSLGYLNGNLVTTLWCKGVSPRDIVFNGSHFLGAIIIGACFDHVDLTNTSITESFLSRIPSTTEGTKIKSSIIVSTNGVPAKITNVTKLLHLDIHQDIYAGVGYKDLLEYMQNYPQSKKSNTYRIKSANYAHYILHKYLKEN